MSDLKPCPFCGGTELSVEPDIGSLSREEYLSVVCHPCQAQGPWCPDGDHEKRWNSRPVENALKDDLIVAMRERNDAMASVDRLTIERDDARWAAERMRTKRDALRAALRELVEAAEGNKHAPFKQAIAKAKEVLGNGTP